MSCIVLALWLSAVGFTTEVATPAATANQGDGPIASPEPDWPQWRGPRRDGRSAETGLLPTWPDGGPRLLWQIDHLGRGWSSPIIVGKRLYITGDKDGQLRIYAFDLAGKPVWQTANGPAWNKSFPGARGCCVFSENRLYQLGAQGRLVCLAAESGQEVWHTDIVERFATTMITWGLSESLLVDGPRLIVTPVGRRALMAALDKTDGRTVWTTPSAPDDQAAYSAPLLFRAAGRRLLANCTGKQGFGVDADSGALVWRVPLENQYATNVATPIYHAGAIFYATAYSGGTLYQLPPAAGSLELTPRWSTTLDTCTGSVISLGDRLLGSGYRNHKSWLCLDGRSGAIRYESKALTTSAAVYADGRLYCLAEDGRVGLLEPTATAFELRGQFRLPTEKGRDHWAHPVLLAGRLYVRYHDTLWCYAVR